MRMQLIEKGKLIISIVFPIIGMTNVRFPSLADYRDIETTNFHSDASQTGLTLEEIMAAIYAKSRDNARTPMQWSDKQSHAGFSYQTTDVPPWINVNPNYTDINVEQALKDHQSIFYYYQKLIQLRRTLPIITNGQYDILHEENTHIFMYKRFNEQEQIIVACNFSQQPITIHDNELNQQLQHFKQILISNYDQNNKTDWLEFRPYEAWAILI